MRTTIKIDDALLKEAKVIAANSGKTVAEVFEDALRESLARRRQTGTRERFVIPVFHGTGPAPGVDLSDWGSIKALLDDEDVAEYRNQDR